MTMHKKRTRQERQQAIALDDERIIRFRRKTIDVETARNFMKRGTDNRNFPFTIPKDVLGSALEAMARVCDVHVPDDLNTESCPRLAFRFVVDAISKFGDEREAEGRRMAERDRPMLSRKRMIDIAKAHAALGDVLEGRQEVAESPSELDRSEKFDRACGRVHFR